jgi:hypothetical protein
MHRPPTWLPVVPNGPVPQAEALARLQQRRVRLAGLAALLHAALFGAAVAAWVHHLGAGSRWADALCATPAIAALGLQAGSWRDTRQALLRVLVVLMFGPLLLLFWAASLDPVAGPSALPRRVDLARLTAGAQLVQSAVGTAADPVPMHSASFGDGTELRLTRLADEAVAARHLAFTGDALQARRAALGERLGLRFPAAPGHVVHAERIGADVLEVRARDEAAALARLAAQGVPLPSSDALRSPGEPSGPATWPLALGATVVHTLVLLGFLAATAVWTTEVPAAAGSVPVSAEVLHRRLRSVHDAGLPCSVFSDSPHELEVELSMRPKRSHRVVLRLQASRRRVQVLERLSSDGDAPQDDDEASMQAPGDDVVDATRPHALRVWGRLRQTTMVRPEWLVQLAPRYEPDGHLQPARRHARLDADGAVALLCAVVTGSGWSWHPRLWWRR